MYIWHNIYSLKHILFVVNIFIGMLNTKFRIVVTSVEGLGEGKEIERINKAKDFLKQDDVCYIIP